jgi:3D (Asp-Asp-Asp) domain-containing protein
MRLIIVLLIGLFLMGCAEAVSENRSLPVSENSAIFTAYNAEVAQTDDTPHITASGHHVNERFVANNCLPFGTKIQVNDQVYEVQDRMHKRHGCDKFDIFMWDYQKAVNFGKKELTYKVI